MTGKKKGKMEEKRNKYQKNVNRNIHNMGHLGRFIELLTYIAKKLGKRVIVIDERETNKTCAVCGHKKDYMSLSERVYQCEVCGIVCDRDLNTAINIMKRFLSQYALWTGYQYFVNSIDNLRHYSRTVNGKTKVPRYHADEGFGELVGSHLL